MVDSTIWTKEQIFNYLNGLFRTKWTKTEIVFFAVFYVYALGFVLFGDRFAKLGIPLSLPTVFGEINQTPVKLYMFELLLLFTAGIAAYQQKERQQWRKNPIVWFVSIFLFYGFARYCVDFTSNPILGVRNSSFVWYLFLPLLLPLLHYSFTKMEALFAAVVASCFLIFLKGWVLRIFFDRNYDLDYVPEVGLVPFLVLGFYARSRVLAFGLLFLLGSGWGSLYYESFSRTALLQFVGVVVLVLVRERNLSVLIRTGFVAVSIFLGMQLWQAKAYLDIKMGLEDAKQVSLQAQYANPVIKTTEKKYVEGYRMSMWKRAWQKYAAAPLFGIGFQKQVVDFIYIREGVLYPNDGTIALSQHQESVALPPREYAPVAGPHNSYLNAIARLGAFGIFLLVFHLWAFFSLFAAKQFFASAIVYCSFIYAFFNVGLEGPIRSFLLLLALGVAIRLAGLGRAQPVYGVRQLFRF